MAGKTQITTGRGRFSFGNIFEPKENQGGQLKYSLTLLIPKTDTKTLGKIKTAIEEAKKLYREKNPGKKLPTNLATTIHDGDGERPSGEDFGPECKGHYVITVNSNNKPVIVDASKAPITEPSEVYSGCYGRAIINFFVYDTAGNKGVTAGLNGVMKLGEGEPLAGGHVTDADWDDDWDDPEAEALGGLLD